MGTVRADGFESKVNVSSDGTEFLIDGVGVTATAAEINAIAGNGLSAAELDVLDGATAGTQVASKAVVADANVNTGVHKATQLHLGVSGSETAMYAAKGRIPVATGANAVVDFPVGADGTSPTANAGDTAGIHYAYTDVGGLLGVTRAKTTIKAATYDPSFIVAGQSISDGSLRGCAIYLPYDATLTGVVWQVHTQGSYTAADSNQVGLYTSDGTTLTLVASSVSADDLWSASVAGLVKQTAFSSTYAAQAGVYWIAVLYNQSAQTTAPQLASKTSGFTGNSADVLMSDTDEYLGFSLAAQASLPASQVWSGVSVSSVCPFLGVY